VQWLELLVALGAIVLAGCTTPPPGTDAFAGGPGCPQATDHASDAAGHDLRWRINLTGDSRRGYVEIHPGDGATGTFTLAICPEPAARTIPVRVDISPPERPNRFDVSPPPAFAVAPNADTATLNVTLHVPSDHPTGQWWLYLHPELPQDHAGNTGLMLDVVAPG